ncbi:hypothetical protein GB931_01430 [Modestobacter sp. I12A-02628]|uniref:GyrI-like small molecule binding domain-containing protein n=1 Tax=Goekera deserti TaxID=2497753 RepID=A0A7K3WGI5_9ACTN|nr:GyrI-like domain-containing protein [Goekera deserti]MPQ96603.1 hypothetical protein [Goekera deserti]NDI47085.1 hypothetical protein [Goekera deserti]NEL55517.1 hypothetical protein [Goekera deserti]
MATGGRVQPKVDLKRELACYRAARDRPQLVDVPDLSYLAVDGHGDPNTAGYAAAVATLYPVAYAVKAAARAGLGRDHVVMPLEALWWADDMAAFTTARDKTRWHWTLLIAQPAWVTAGLVEAAVARRRAEGRGARLDDVRLLTLSEGRCVQALHVGPFDAEAELLRRIHEEFVPAHGLTLTGRHHEVYLSDARRVEPARLRTILRQPVSGP